LSRDHPGGLPEVHDEEPEHSLVVDRIGVSGYRGWVRICGFDGCIDRGVTIDIYVDLPGNMRGVHVSRFIEVLDEARVKSFDSIYDFLEYLARESLVKHSYSRRVEVFVKTSFYPRDTGSIEALFGLKLSRDDRLEYLVSIKLYGLTVCPCVQKVYSYLENTRLEDTPSHMQRTMLEITVESPSRINLEELIRIGLDSFSAPLKSYLKRYDEYLLVKNALKKPRFVEDVLRSVIVELMNRFNSGKVRFRVRAVSEESIHPYNVYGEINIES